MFLPTTARPSFGRPLIVALGAATAIGAGLFVAAAPALASPSTHAVHVDGVTLQVPSSWRLESSRGLPGCIVDPGAKKPTAAEQAYGQNHCQLEVFAGRRLPQQAAPDDLYSLGDAATCVRGSRGVSRRTVAAAGERIDGEHAEYRRFGLACLKQPIEQWFVGRQPGVVIQRTRMTRRTEAAALRAVDTAKLPTGHGIVRVFTGTPVGAGDTTVTLTRTRLVYDDHGGTHATGADGRPRLFRVPAGIKVLYMGRGANLYTLTRAQLIHDVRHGFPHSGDLQPEITVHSAVGSKRLDAIEVTLASTR